MTVFGFDIQTDSREAISGYRESIYKVMENTRISLPKAKTVVGMLVDGKISTEQFNAYIGSNVDNTDNLDQRLSDWQNFFGTFNDDDLEFIHSKPQTANYKRNASSIRESIDIIRAKIKGQDDAINRLVPLVWVFIESVKNNIPMNIPPALLVGNTGVGKSELMSTLCDVFNAIFIKINASTIVPPGYRGGDSVNDQIFSQYIDKYPDALLNFPSPSGRIPVIIMVQEIDKTALLSKEGGWRHEHMKSFMALIENSVLHRSNPTAPNSSQSIDLRDCLVIFDGCFSGIENVVAKRIGASQTVGFNTAAPKNVGDLRKLIQPDDLTRFGLMPEFTGRISGNIICMNDMTEDVLYEILTESTNSPVHHNEMLFTSLGKRLSFTKGALKAIAREAQSRNLGARVLNGIVTTVMAPVYYRIQSAENEFVIDDNDVYRALGHS